MIDDAEMLRRYAEEGAEAAFAEVVRRNIDLVYATALRVLGDSHRAQDVVQSVFLDVARKAQALRRHPAFVSWLYTSTRYAALKTLRGEQRRQLREQQAYAMQPADEPQIDWERLRPMIDEVLEALGKHDREVVLLRYFRGLSFAEIAAVLHVNDGAARMRVDRALGRMNRLLARRGVHSTAAAVGLALGAQPSIAAPAALAASTTAMALSGAAAAGGSGALGTFLVMTKLQLAVGLFVLAGATTAVVELRANRALHAQLAAPGSTSTATLTRENQVLNAQVAKIAAHDPATDELARLRSRIAVLKARPVGVTDATLHPPQNLGRATPAAAAETFCWAVRQQDLDLVASFVRIKDNTPEDRAAFMAKFSPVVRARYRTPERVCAAAMFGATVVHIGPADERLERMQVVDVEDHNGPGEVRIKSWLQSTSGREIPGGDFYTVGPDGWGMRPFALTNPDIVQALQERIDPVTGDFHPPALKPAPRS